MFLLLPGTEVIKFWIFLGVSNFVKTKAPNAYYLLKDQCLFCANTYDLVKHFMVYGVIYSLFANPNPYLELMNAPVESIEI